ncbi:MAG: CgeB family protein [Candidatus Binataceae bacterium]
MRIVIFCHSLISDWNHGNAHFLRGIAAELIARGHLADVYEPYDSWSLRNLLAEYGSGPMEQFSREFPQLRSTRYDAGAIDLERELDNADIVIVHEWNTAELVRRIGQHRARTKGMIALFHDTHHRAVSDPHSIPRHDLRDYDGVLAFGESLRSIYLKNGWADNVFVWHEAADIRTFRPYPEIDRSRDLVWIGNWGDDERSNEIREFILLNAQELALRTTVYGVRYPDEAVSELKACGVEYRGWLPNHQVPRIFASFRTTVHVPRRAYAEELHGIPTIRVFEALACGIPLICTRWDDTEALFGPEDFVTAKDPADLRRKLKMVLNDRAMADEMAERGRQTILARHTCSHRVDELLGICSTIAGSAAVNEAGII